MSLYVDYIYSSEDDSGSSFPGGSHIYTNMVDNATWCKSGEYTYEPEITFDDFEKVQFRVAKVLTCEAVKKTKLLKFELQIGDEKRTIVSGIQKYYKPEELIGKKLVVCTNLKPRKICGIESQGMIISAWDDKDNLSVLTLEKDIIEGAEIG